MYPRSPYSVLKYIVDDGSVDAGVSVVLLDSPGVAPVDEPGIMTSEVTPPIDDADALSDNVAATDVTLPRNAGGASLVIVSEVE